MKITWIGHSCFRIESSGYTVVLDPYADNSVPGLLPVRETANQVLCSHGHRDHNASSLIKLQEAAENPFKITQIHTYHDGVKGMERGENTIHIMDDGAFKAVHFGDLGCRLEPGQLEQLKSIDVALVPVGGFFTIDAYQAAELVRMIRPKIVIPMHYTDPVREFGFDVIDTVDTFISQMEQVTVITASEIDVDCGSNTQVVVMQPRNAVGHS